ncbi:hypothetical protein AVEN_130585-1 [Araneus ventricosus]|uniref:Uncharacterized protein n=1 Tax=Araneus ventricosus TaxID=182803 RepID=A0A4Y2HIP1_ARAVE|nr:hypothetical protein AVEN_130585-1 [Araneus ventricosus]
MAGAWWKDRDFLRERFWLRRRKKRIYHAEQKKRNSRNPNLTRLNIPTVGSRVQHRKQFYLQKNPSWERQFAVPNLHCTVNEWLPATHKNPSAGAERGDVFQ